MAYDVFVSYSSADKPAADAVCAALEARGIRCWIAPRDIKPSDSWAAAIVEAIREARIFLLVFSRHANESDQVQREVERAANSGKHLLTLRIEDVSPQAALEYYLNTPHWLDAITPPFQAHLDTLADACISLLALPRADQEGAQGVADTRPITHRVGARRRGWLIAGLVIVVVAALVTGRMITHHVSSSAGGELVLTSATDPGPNPFMPPAAGADAATPTIPTGQPPLTLQSRGDGKTVATQPLPGDREGLYGGRVNNTAPSPGVGVFDRDQMIGFFSGHAPQAGAFVESLNSDPSRYWSGGRQLTISDIPAYLRELTPVVLRLDTRVTDHGFDSGSTTAVQAVLQAGTALLVDAHGVPRVRGLSGSPLTAAVGLKTAPKTVGTAWPGYRPGALAEVLPTVAVIAVFVLIDIITGRPFTRRAGTAGSSDSPRNKPVTPPSAGTSEGPVPSNPATADMTPECQRLAQSLAQLDAMGLPQGPALHAQYDHLCGIGSTTQPAAQQPSPEQSALPAPRKLPDLSACYALPEHVFDQTGNDVGASNRASCVDSRLAGG